MMTLPVSLRGAIASALAAALALSLAPAPPLAAEPSASRLRSFQAGLLDAGHVHVCAVITTGALRCWGDGSSGALGYGGDADIGDNEAPGAAGPVDLGVGRTVRSVGAGFDHTCAILDDGSVRCWGGNAEGQLGYGPLVDASGYGDQPGEVPSGLPPVDLGQGRTATAISAGVEFTCAILDDGSVRCWGFSGSGQLGYGSTAEIGDDEAPSAAGPLDLGPGRTATAISAGSEHACAILDDGSVRCWGQSFEGQRGYGDEVTWGDDPGETPASAGSVDLGPGRTAVAISAGFQHTCAILDDGSVRCWGDAASGQLGYGSTEDVGDEPGDTPAAAGAVDLGPGRSAIAIAADSEHSCAVLDDGSTRCWGFGGNGQLGVLESGSVGDDPGETPADVPTVSFGSGLQPRAVSVGEHFTCWLISDGAVRCSGENFTGQLGYGHTSGVGDDPGETPDHTGAVDVGGLMIGSVGDLSLRLSGKKTTSVGRKLRVVVLLENAGLDPAAPEVTIAVPKRFKLLRGVPDQGTFDKPTRTWSPQAVGPQDPARLVLTLRARKVGRGTIRSEIVVDPWFFLDTDSVPGNAALDEDDLATRRLKVRKR